MYVCIYLCMYVSRYVYLSLSLFLSLSLSQALNTTTTTVQPSPFRRGIAELHYDDIPAQSLQGGYSWNHPFSWSFIACALHK